MGFSVLPTVILASERNATVTSGDDGQCQHRDASGAETGKIEGAGEKQRSRLIRTCCVTAETAADMPI